MLWRQAIAVMVLLAFCWRGFVVQTHVHPTVDGWGAHAAAAIVATGHSGGHPASPADCPVCQEGAHAGHAILPTFPAWGVPVVGHVWSPIAQAASWRHRRRSHGWRSRGPPPSFRTPATA